jgi:hypothetical protein
MGVGDQVAFGEAVLEIQGFQMEETDIIIQVQSQTTKVESTESYFIGRSNFTDEVSRTPGRLFKSNFKGHDRGLVTIAEILEIVKKEEWTNVMSIGSDKILKLSL